MSSNNADGDASTARVQLYVRQGCHLCDVAEATAREVCTETGEALELVDIDADPLLRERWTDQVPVTMVDGRQHDFWRVDPDRLRAALHAAHNPHTGQATGGSDA